MLVLVLWLIVKVRLTHIVGGYFTTWRDLKLTNFKFFVLEGS